MMIIWVLFEQFDSINGVPVASKLNLSTSPKPEPTWDRSQPIWYGSQASCDRSQDRSLPFDPLVSSCWYRSFSLRPIATFEIGRKIGLRVWNTLRPLLVSVSVHFGIGRNILVSVAMTRDRSQVSLLTRETWNLSWFRSLLSGIGRNIWDRLHGSGIGTRAVFWAKIDKINHFKSTKSCKIIFWRYSKCYPIFSYRCGFHFKHSTIG